MRRIILLPIILSLFALVYYYACGGGSSPNTPANIPVSIEELDGTTGVATDSTFEYTFSKAVDTSTVTDSTFYIALATTPDNALDSDVSCSSSTTCTLAPVNAMEEGTSYTITLTTGIQYTDGTSFAGLTASFITESSTLVVMVRDANSGVIGATGSTGIFPTSFNITFSEEMDDSSITTAGDITLTCSNGGTAVTPTISVAKSGTIAKTYTVTVADAYKYQLMICTLTLTTNIKSADGVALASAATYAFTNACAIDDDFNMNSSACWSIVSDNSTYTSWADFTTLTFSADTAFDPTLVNNTLDYTASGLNATANNAVAKYFSIDSSGFSIIVHFSGVLNYSQYNDNEAIVVGLASGNTIAGALLNKHIDIILKQEESVGNPSCAYSYFNGTATRLDDCDLYTDAYIKISANTSSFTITISEDGVNYRDFSEPAGGSLPASSTEFLSGLSNTGIVIVTSSRNGFPASGSAKLNSITTTGTTSDSLY